MNIIKYLQEAGFDTVDASFYSKIEEWTSWYNANVKKFHRYRVYRGSGCYERCHRKSLKMAKKVSEDIANLLLNERVMITLSDEKTEKYFHDVLDANNFAVLGNSYQERKAYCGTVAYVPYLKDMKIDASGNVVSASKIGINYVMAQNIFPLSWENDDITEVAFLFVKTYRHKKYAHLEIHKLNDDKTYIIENHVILIDKSVLGKEIDPVEWNKIPHFANMAQKIETGSISPQFIIDKLNIVNNASEDSTNPMGISIFANAEDVLAGLDLKFDSFCNEFSLGRKRIFVAPEMLTDKNGNMVFDPDDSVFYQLPEDYSQQMGNDPIKESNMELRVEQHIKAINADLEYLSFLCGFGTERYKFDAGGVKTATEVISENSEMFRTIKKHEIILEAVIKKLVAIVIRLANNIGEGLDPDVNVAINFDDSIIEDKETERKNDRQDVSMGVMSQVEYRSRWYGETEEEAAKRLPEQVSGVME